MKDNIKVICHSCIKISTEKTIYIDPFKIKEKLNDADIIFITHSHYDHFSEEDILKIKNESTIIVITNDLVEKSIQLGFKKENIIEVKPNQNYKIGELKFETIPAYNVNKNFHPKENNWVGYILELNKQRYYIAGDTDITEENKKVKCDVAFVPVGGTYTMTATEAAELVNLIKPKVAIPIHYGEIVGTEQDANKFKQELDTDIKCKILI